MRFFATSPFAIALVWAHFLPYALAAWGFVICRMATRKNSRRETALFAVFTGALLLELLQLRIDGFDFFGRETWGLPRYFGVFAPILWIFAAYLLASLWNRWTGVPRIVARAAIVAALGWVAISQNFTEIRLFYMNGARHDAVVAAQRIAPVIRADYRGPRRQETPKRTLHEYFSTRRPVVFGDFSAAAWMVRGQSEGALQGRGLCPYQDNYLFIRVGSGYGGVNKVDSDKYEYVTSVRGGLGTEWRLFRRKPLTDEQRKWYNNKPFDRKGKQVNETRGFEGQDRRRMRQRRP